jgi:hypothetical protein
MKIHMTRPLLGALLGTCLAMAVPGSAAFADGDDTSADGFAAIVEDSQAAVLRVPINEKGEELADKAELRVYAGEPESDSTKLPAVFESSVDVAGQPVLDRSDIDRDSSTSGWYGWRGNGWYGSYYYYGYRPYYYNYGSYYNYGYNPYYYNYYGYNPYGYYGYRYYYYPRY